MFRAVCAHDHEGPGETIEQPATCQDFALGRTRPQVRLMRGAQLIEAILVIDKVVTHSEIGHRSRYLVETLSYGGPCAAKR